MKKLIDSFFVILFFAILDYCFLGHVKRRDFCGRRGWCYIFYEAYFATEYEKNENTKKNTSTRNKKQISLYAQHINRAS